LIEPICRVSSSFAANQLAEPLVRGAAGVRWLKAAVGSLCAGVEKPAAQIASSIAITNHEFLYRASDMVLHLTELTHRTRQRKERCCGAILIFVAPDYLPGLPPRFSKRTLGKLVLDCRC
jgi:hypothetical protein